jgi:acetyl-CoA carboxylase carboxyltransferase component
MLRRTGRGARVGRETDAIDIVSPTAGTVTSVAAAGTRIDAGSVLVTVEVMKTEHPVTAPRAGRVADVRCAPGTTVGRGDVLVRLAVDDAASAEPTAAEPAAAGEPADLRELRRRRGLLADDARPDAVRRRRERGSRTARENVAALLDPGSFVEYGGLAIAAQRSRRSVEELQAATPADGLLTGFGTVGADVVGPARAKVAVAAYDATVLAGTQGHTNHLKKDRLFELVARTRTPLVVFAEGGGGRPGDTDVVGASWLQVPAFHLFARLSGRVPTIAVVHGRCFAGNAALAGCADLVIATERANLGMAGPAMIEGGGLGRVDPDDIGPVAVHRRSGAVDVVVPDERRAAATARRLLTYFQGEYPDLGAADQTELRSAVPDDRRTVYDVRRIVSTLFDRDSVLELRRDHAPGMVTALARLAGRPVGVLANDPHHLGGAIDAEAADSAVRLLSLCDAHGLPVVVLCDTPGFMVGPAAETVAGVRRFGRLFVVGANLRVPIVAVVTRRAYGLGAQAMLGGHLKVPVATLVWPTGELGPMGLEGAVRLGFRRELEAVEDDHERAELEAQMVALARANAHGLNVATFAEVDDVIDPAETRDRVAAALTLAGPAPGTPHAPVLPW